MKKVIVLSIIAMLALGVFAMAAGSISVGPTCQPATLTVTSNIVVVQGFQATATSYDATFCGATGDPLSYTVASPEGGVLLASLTVKSNMATIGVAFEASGSPSGSILENLTDGKNVVCGFYYYQNGQRIYDNGSGIYNNSTSWPSWWNPSNSANAFFSMTLLGSGSPYNGKLDVVLPPNGTQTWIQAGKYVLTMQFFVFPKTSWF